MSTLREKTLTDLQLKGITPMTQKKYLRYDNVPMESFWGVLKSELVHHRHFRTRQEAIREITEHIEIFYNRQRRQQRLGYLSPAAFIRKFHMEQIAA